MTNDTPKAVQAYLARLDAALAEVESEVRGDIVQGIREELAGLSDAEVDSRIRELGDPAFIAAEARAALPGEEPPGPPSGRTVSIVAVLLVIVGSFVIPIIGPLVGLVWISMSRTFSRREKVGAWLGPVVVGFVLAAVIVLASAAGQGSGDGVNPVLPLASLTSWHLAILLPYVLLPIVGIVLFVRAHRRGWWPISSTGAARDLP